jgi:hypothetical protein
MTAPGRNLLVLLVGDHPPQRLHDAIAARAEPPARIHVVAPALVRPLDWLATAEDDAHRQAEVRAFEAEWTLTDAAEVEGAAGDADPIQAIEDALRGFPADEILIAGEAADADLEAALSRFGLPVTRLDGAPRPRHSAPYRALRGLAGGHSNATPFILFFGVNSALALLGILLSLLVLLILWLIGTL